MAYSGDITSALAFGHDLNALEHGDGELQQHITRVFELLARRTLAPFPYWHVVKPPADRAAERSLAVIHDEITRFIAAAQSTHGGPPGTAARRPRTSSRAC